MPNKILFLSLLFCSATLLAQKNKTPLPYRTVYAPECRITLSNTELKEDNAQAVKKYLKNTVAELSNPLCDLRLDFEKESPAGRHYKFTQLYQGIPVYHAGIKVNMDKRLHIRSLMNECVRFELLTNTSSLLSSAEKLNQNGFTENLASKLAYSLVYSSELNICLTSENTALLVRKILFNDPSKGINRLILANEDAEIIYESDLNRYWRAVAATDTIITGKVFKPDPLTTAHVAYGGNYVDNNDADNTQLNNERISVSIPATFNNGTFYLENAFAKITEIESPVVTAATSSTPLFDFTRSQSGFEDVNTLYHVTVMQQYIQSLGFNNMLNQKLDIDPHAVSGQDNSYFSGGGGNPVLCLGEGGVDDAEDADVIIHEYGHALSWSANNNNFGSSDRGALDEAFGDYQAATYSRNIDPFNWADIFSWDGHNPFWPGRSAATTKIYPSSLLGQIHSDGEIWSSAMMEIWTALGKTVTDKLMYQSLYHWSDNMTMPQAALLVMQADTLQNGGVNFSTLCTCFKNYGLYNGNCNIGVNEHFNANAIEIVNSSGFADGSAPLFVLFPNFEKKLETEVFDLSGRKVKQMLTENSNRILLQPYDFEKGLYLITVRSSSGRIYTTKILRIN